MEEMHDDKWQNLRPWEIPMATAKSHCSNSNVDTRHGLRGSNGHTEIADVRRELIRSTDLVSSLKAFLEIGGVWLHWASVWTVIICRE